MRPSNFHVWLMDYFTDKSTYLIYYHPQTKFAKVMFLHMSVCPRGSTWAGTPPGRYPPGQVHPSWAGTPPATVHAGIRSTSGGTHPTGMHSCSLVYFTPCKQSKISKRSWVLRECLERVPENIDAMRELLQYGLRGTDLEALIAIGKGEDGGR